MTAPDTSDVLDAEVLEPVDTEAPEIEAVAPADEAAHATESIEVHPRDDKGRFTNKAEPDANSAVPDAATDATTAPTTEPENPLAGAEPFSVRVNGEAATIDGGHILPGEGAVFSAEALPRLQEVVSRGLLYERERHQFAAERKAFEAERSRPSANEAKYEKAALTMLDVLKNEETLVRLLDPEYRQLFFRRMEVDLERLELEHSRTQYQSRETAEQSAQQEQAVTQHVTQQVQALATQFPELTAQDIAEAQAYADSIRPALVRTVGPNDAEFLNAGWQVGQAYMVHGPIEQYLSRIATERRKATEQAKKLQEAAKYNATQAAKPKAPPAPAKAATSAAKAPPQKSGKWGGYETEAEFMDAFMRGDLQKPA